MLDFGVVQKRLVEEWVLLVVVVVMLSVVEEFGLLKLKRLGRVGLWVVVVVSGQKQSEFQMLWWLLFVVGAILELEEALRE